MNALERILQRIENYREEMIRLQIGLTAIPALSPENGGTGEHDKAQFLIERLRLLGFNQIELCSAPDPRVPSGNRPNIIATLPGKTERSVWILTHMDIVPPGELSFWSEDPYKAYEKGGRLYGRGTEDNQQDLVASIFAAKAFIDEQISPAPNVRLAFVSDEETNSRYGLNYLLEKRAELFGGSDLYVVPDFGSDDGSKIEIAEKSLLWVRFKTTGRQCHASRPGAGLNAFRAASFLVTKLDELRGEFNLTDPIFEPSESTFEPTRKDANVPNVNTIPGEDVFYMDCRVLPQYDLEDILGAMRAKAAEIEKNFNVTIEMSVVVKEQAPPAVEESADIVRSLHKAIKRVYGVDAHPVGVGGGTVAAALRRRALPAAVWCRIGETAHQPDENCLIESMIGNAKVYACLFFGAH